MGCLLGGLGQELSGISDVFRYKIEECFSAIGNHIALCLEEARQAGEIAIDSNVNEIANLMVDCWEGAALRSRLRKSPASLSAMLDFCFRSLVATSPERRSS
ncbi:MAG: TetR family transcriptional regulator C-terminal domain-containing protein [Hyphomicrobiaceae bacterium]